MALTIPIVFAGSVALQPSRESSPRRCTLKRLPLVYSYYGPKDPLGVFRVGSIEGVRRLDVRSLAG